MSSLFLESGGFETRTLSLINENVPPIFLHPIFLSPWRFSPLVGQGEVIIEDSWLHSDTTQSVGLLCIGDRPDAQTSTWQHTTLTTDRHPCPPEEFEPKISAGERLQTHALDRAATGTGNVHHYIPQYYTIRTVHYNMIHPVVLYQYIIIKGRQ